MATKKTTTYGDMLKQFNDIPRNKSAEPAVKSNPKKAEDRTPEERNVKNIKEQKAIKDLRRLLVLLEKSVIGKIEEKDLQEINDNTEQWLESIGVLKQYIEVTGIK